MNILFVGLCKMKICRFASDRIDIRAVDYVPDKAGTQLNFSMMSEAVTTFRATKVMPQAPLQAIREDRKNRGRGKR